MRLNLARVARYVEDGVIGSKTTTISSRNWKSFGSYARFTCVLPPFPSLCMRKWVFIFIYPPVFIYSYSCLFHQTVLFLLFSAVTQLFCSSAIRYFGCLFPEPCSALEVLFRFLPQSPYQLVCLLLSQVAADYHS